MGCSLGNKSKPKRGKCDGPGLRASAFVISNRGRFQEIYKQGKLIGSGVHAEVHTCFLKESGLKRAVKIIRKDLLASSSYLSRIEHEKEIIKLLDHPSIIRLYEFFEDAKRVYIVREFCDGTELLREISKDQTFTENQAARIAQQLLQVVSYVHSQGIVHTNINPEHIFLFKMNIKLTNFTMASRIRSKAVKREGFWPYESPELMDGILDTSCDLWSCGVILYTLLCGVHPFHATNQARMIENIKRIKISQNEQWSEISKGARDLICRLLCKESSRLNAEQALAHPWIVSYAQNEVPETPIVKLALKNLVEFRFVSSLVDAVHTFIMTQRVSENDLKTMGEVFKKIDKNGDGLLSKEELIGEYENLFGFIQAESEVERIIKEVDSDENGLVSYSEFLKAAVDVRKTLSMENLRSAFRNFDKDHSGKLSFSEVERALSERHLMDDETWAGILKKFDENGDGEIELAEFEKIMMSKFH